MTRFVVDASAVLEIARKGRAVRPEHELFAPTLLRSQTLSALHKAVQRGEKWRGRSSRREVGHHRVSLTIWPCATPKNLPRMGGCAVR